MIFLSPLFIEDNEVSGSLFGFYRNQTLTTQRLRVQPSRGLCQNDLEVCGLLSCSCLYIFGRKQVYATKPLDMIRSGVRTSPEALLDITIISCFCGAAVAHVTCTITFLHIKRTKIPRGTYFCHFRSQNIHSWRGHHCFRHPTLLSSLEWCFKIIFCM